MLYTIVAALFVVFPAVISYPGKGSRAFGATTRIVNGRIAQRNEIPYIVAIGYAFGPPIYGYSKFCGGSIYNATFIISAAHCFSPGNFPSEYAVMAGGLNSTAKCFKTEKECGAQIIRLKSIHVHKSFDYYNGSHFANDIAVLELEKPLVFNEGVQPIPIAPAGTVAKGVARVSGWGDTKKRLALWENYEKEAPSDLLLTTEVDIIPRDQCDQMFYEARVVEVVWWDLKIKYHPDSGVAPYADTLLCAFDLKGKRDICNGDSGGPLQCSRKKADGGEEKYLCGVVSVGNGCGLLPSGYTNVAQYHDWILEQMKN